MTACEKREYPVGHRGHRFGAERLPYVDAECPDRHQQELETFKGKLRAIDRQQPVERDAAGEDPVADQHRYGDQPSSNEPP